MASLKAHALLFAGNVAKLFMLQEMKTPLAHKKKNISWDTQHETHYYEISICFIIQTQHSHRFYLAYRLKCSETSWKEHHMKSADSLEIQSQSQARLSGSLALLWRGMNLGKLVAKLRKDTGSFLSQCNTKHPEWKENLLLCILRLFPAIFFQ